MGQASSDKLATRPTNGVNPTDRKVVRPKSMRRVTVELAKNCRSINILRLVQHSIELPVSSIIGSVAWRMGLLV